MPGVDQHQAFDETTSTIYPIQFKQIGTLSNIPVPLARVTTCGLFSLEVLQEIVSTDPPQGRYHVVTLQQCPRGSSTALTLLKVLTSQPDHYTSKDWLTEHLSRNRNDQGDEEEGWGKGLVRIDNVVSLLRNLLCPPGIAKENILRKMLVAYTKNHRDSGSGYQLASEPLVWLDVDVIAASVKQAVFIQQGQEALPYWEQVYALASKGSYLTSECYSDWAKEKRLCVEGSLRQSVHALRRLYLELNAEAGEEQVLLLLRSYCPTHLTDEDLLRSLMDLLGKHGYLQEAEDYYHRLCQRLALEGQTPDQRTQKTVQSLRSRQSLISRDVLFSHTIPQRIIEVVNTPEDFAQQEGTQDMEPSRRHFLQTLGIVSAKLSISPHIQGISSFAENRALNSSQASIRNLATITQQFRAMQRRGDVFITHGIHAHVQTIQKALEQTMNDKKRHELWKVLAQTQTVAGFNPIKKIGRGKAKTFLESAVASAQQSGDHHLLGASLGHLGHFTLREEHNLTKASQLLHQAQEYVQALHPLQGWFALVMASIAAKGGHKQQCEAYLTDALTIASQLPQTPETTDLYFTDFNLTSVQIFIVNCWLTLENATKAYQHLSKMNLENLSDNRRASAYCDAAKACAMMGEFELAQQLALRAIEKAALTQQSYVIPRCLTVAQTIQQKASNNSYTTAITEYAYLTLQHS